jgi:SAM-dependent methyltransferase
VGSQPVTALTPPSVYNPPGPVIPAPQTVAVPACSVCGQPSSRTLFASGDLVLPVPGLFRYVECSHCLTVYQSPRVRDEDLPLCYPTGFYTHGVAGAWLPTPAPPGSLRARLRDAVRHAADGVSDGAEPVWLRAAGHLLALSPVTRRRARLGLVDPLGRPEEGHARCLEVGPGQGVDLYCLRELGWDPHGLEVDPLAAETARATSGCEARVGTLTSTDYADGSFDLVYMSHVFEHLPDPAPSLRRCRELLRPGGRLVLLSPSPQALTARRYGSLSPVWDPPRHLVLPPLRALLHLVARSGFVDARARMLASQAAVNARAARRRRRGLAWDPARPGTPGFLDRAFALAESLLISVGWPVGEEVVLDARKPHAGA